MERLSKKSDRPFTGKLLLAAVMATCLLACALVPAFVSDDSAAETAGDWEYDLDGDDAVLIGYSGSDSTVVIPSQVDGKNVVEVDIGNVDNPELVKAIEFEDSSKVTTITSMTGFSGLTAIDLPGTLEAIGNNAFSDLPLVSVTGVSVIVNLGDYAFSECEALTTFEPKIASLGIEAFSGCAAIGSLTLYGYDCVIDSDTFSGCTSLIAIYGSDAVVEVGNASFEDNAVLEIFEPALSAIGDNAFKGCTEIEKITISGAKVIGDYAFSGCTSLTIVKGAMFEDKSGTEDVKVGEEAFFGCTNLNTFVPSSVETIGDKAFSGCEALKRITTKDVETVGFEAFSGCSSLESFFIGNDLESIGGSAFEGCDSLVEFYGASDDFAVIDGILYKVEATAPTELVACPVNKAGAVAVADGTAMIRASAFYGCDMVESVALPSDTALIGMKAFYGCNSLESVTAWATTSLEIAQDVDKHTFQKTIETSEDITTVFAYDMPAELDDWSNWCAMADESEWTYVYDMGAKKVTLTGYLGSQSAVTIPNMVTGHYVTAVDITRVDNPDAVTSISFATPSKITTLAAGTFDLFTNVTMIFNIPESVTEIGINSGKNAIACPNLESITVHDHSEHYLSLDGVLYSYETVSSVKQLTLVACPVKNTDFRMPSGKIVGIGDGAFCGGTIESFNIPADVKTIGDYAFADCKNLKYITGGAGVTSIGDSAFYGCENLKAIEFAKAETIGDSVFEGCESLATVSIATAKTIGDRAFYGCESLTKFSIPKNLASLGEMPFVGCKSLVTLDSSSSAFKVNGGILYRQNSANDLSLVFCPVNKTGSVAVTDKTTEILAGAFYGCEKVTSIDLPATVSKIESEAFYGCEKLELVLAWNLDGIIIEQGNTVGTFEKVDGKKTEVRAFKAPMVLDDGAKGSVMKQLGNNVYAYLVDKSPYYSMYIFVHGTGTVSDKSIDFETYTKPWIGEAETGDFGWNKNLTSNVKEVYFQGGVTNIPDAMFTDARSAESDEDSVCGFHALVKVEGAEKATYVGKAAFYGCESLTRIDISGANSIGDAAFFGCSCLESITLSALKETTTVPAIGMGAFINCINLESITLPSAVKNINQMTFVQCKNLKSAVMPGVTSIGAAAFAGCKSMTKVSFAANTEIGEMAFIGCESLSDITQSNIKTIGAAAFAGGQFTVLGETVNYKPCVSLEKLELPNVTTIGYGAFIECTGLKTVSFKSTAELQFSLPGSQATIPFSPFSGCTGITSFSVTGTTGAGTYYTDNGVLMKSEKVDSKTTLKCIVCFPQAVEGAYTAPSDIEKVMSCAFKDSLLTEITLGSKVSEIGDCAFWNCKNLEKVIVFGMTDPDDEVGLFTIMQSDKVVIYTASDIAAFNFTEAGVSGDRVKQMIYFGDDESEVYGYTVGTGTEKTLFIIGTGEMKDFTSTYIRTEWLDVYSIVLPDGLTTIGSYAFSGCANVQKITIPSSVITISNSAFAGCAVLGSVTLNSGLITIGDDAFADTVIKAIDIPSSVKTIGNEAFAGCASLEAVNFKATPTVNTIGDAAFEKTAIKSFTIPASLTAMGDNPFAQISALGTINNQSGSFVITDGILFDKDKKRVILCITDITKAYTLPSTVKGVDSYAFLDSRNMKSVSFPEGIETIGEGAFKGCWSIDSVYIPFGKLKTIGASAFEDCRAVETIALPEAVCEIGEKAFSGCGAVKLAVLKCLIDEDIEKTLTVGTDAFDGVPMLYATPSVIELIEESGYTGTTEKLTWCGDSVYGYVFEEDDGIIELRLIGTGNMEDREGWEWDSADSINSIEIESGVKKLGAHVFEGLTDLVTIVIPETISAIPADAFHGCESLMNVVLSQSMTSIGHRAFYGCEAMTGEVVIDSVTSTLTIPEDVKSIGFNAFYGSGLKRIVFECNATVGGSAFPGDYDEMLLDGKTKLGLFVYDANTGKWADDNCTVTWMIEGKIVKTVPVKNGDKVPEYDGEKPVKAADKQYYYTFKNWTPEITDKDSEGNPIITKDTLFTAVFLSSPQLYDVVYTDATTGKTFTDKSGYGYYALKDNMFTVPKDKVFAGWNVNGEKKDVSSKIHVESRTVVTAVWDDSYTVTYAPGLHGIGEIAAVQTTGSIVLPGDNAYEAEAGWKFVGWDVNGTICKAGATIAVTKSQTITATWEGINTVTYKSGEYGTGADYSEKFPLSLTLADSRFQPQSEKYYFSGWEVDGRIYQPGETVSIGTSVDAVAQWGVKFDVVYDANGGTGQMKVDYVMDGATYQLKKSTFTAPYTYAFKAWDVDGENKDVGDLIVVTEDIVIKAVWELGIPVSFNANGGTGVMNDVYVLKDSAYMPGDCAFTAPEKKAFRTWSVKGADVVNPIYINAPVTFQAEWSNLYAVTLDPNGGTGEPKVSYVKNSYTFPDCGFVAPDGTVFFCWTVDGVQYYPEESISVSGDMTAKAEWVNFYTVGFDANGGSGAMDTEYTIGIFTAPECAFTAPEGDPMVFECWTLPNGTPVYAGEIITVEVDTILKAIWVPAYLVTFDSDGRAGTMLPAPASGKYVLPECTFLPNTPIEFFDMWMLPDGTYAAAGETIQVVGDMTVTATWIDAHQITVTSNSYGTASADASYAVAGTVVKLTKTPHAGCDFVSWEVTPSAVTIVDDSFTMPDRDVTVKAVFKVHVDTEITKSCNYGSVTIPIDSTITSDCTIELSMVFIEKPKQSNIPKDAIVYSIDVTVKNGSKVVSTEGKTMTVFIAYKLALGERTDDLYVYYVSDNGQTVQKMDAKYDASRGGMVFKTTHFSDYAIVHGEIKAASADYLPAILAVIVAMIIVVVVLLFVWRRKKNSI